MANSGVYLRGRYESNRDQRGAGVTEPSHGAVYGFIAPEPAVPRTPDVWQSYDITLIGRTVTVVHNGQRVIDRQEVPGLPGVPSTVTKAHRVPYTCRALRTDE